MRRRVGDEIRLFNADCGEWSASLAMAERRRAVARVLSRARAPGPEPDLWLLFAPPKGPRLDLVIEKGTELGVARFLPTRMQRSVVDRVNPERLGLIATEAAEQCGRLTVPPVEPIAGLDRRLAAWPQGRRLILCDETRGAGRGETGIMSITDVLAAARGGPPGPWAILVGPEGGLAPTELDGFAKLPFVVGASLGPRVLRAETAAILAVGLWQFYLGDGQEDGRAPPTVQAGPTAGPVANSVQQDR